MRPVGPKAQSGGSKSLQGTPTRHGSGWRVGGQIVKCPHRSVWFVHRPLLYEPTEHTEINALLGIP